ncbi:MAG TPA: phosphatase PAP2 family protein [Frankiaceae bacterium]|nr:phosphatase PAP2 family protein [Frankiaceae bacterium]
MRAQLLDQALFERVASARAPTLDGVLPRLSRAADHGLLWWAAAGVLGLSGGQRRRAALRGLASLGLASAVANIPAKLSARRARPSLQDVPLPRQLRRQPTSSSFPSGHSASAAAFATGVALETPAAGAGIGLVAAAVAYSRIYVGVHYPGDVLAGVALGAGCAVLTTRTWPRRPAGPAQARPASSDAPSLPRGRGLVAVVNSGAGNASRGDIAQQLQELLPDARIVQPGDDEDLDEVMAKAADGAQALGVAGGDGTVNCAAAAALAADLPLAVFPAGTLDHFARDAGLHELGDTASAVERGRAAAVDVAWVEGDPERPQGRIFLNTASLGSYPELVEVRERLQRYIGKWPAVALGTVRVLRRSRPLELDIDGEHRRLWLLFAGNCGYRPAGFAPTYRPRLDDELLDVRLLDAQRPFARSRLVLAVVLGRLGQSRVYEERLTARVNVRARDGARELELARDGEVGTQAPVLTLAKYPKRLVVYRPME